MRKKTVPYLKDVQQNIENTDKHILKNYLLNRAASGCDTVSAFYGAGKCKLLKKFHKFENFNLKIFLESNGDAKKFFKVGEKFIMKRFNLCTTLEERL